MEVPNYSTINSSRQLVTAFIQTLQGFIQNRIIATALKSDKPFQPPLPLRLLSRSAMFRRKFAQVLAYGLQPELLDDGLV